MALLDPEYREWRPEGKASYRLDDVAGVPLLTVETDGICHVLGEMCDATATPVARFISGRALNEVSVFEESSFLLLRTRLTDGQWRLSRNYEAAADGFLPRPCRSVRPLGPEDEGLLESACQAFPAIGGSCSTMRDFGYMVSGLPVTCYGAIVDSRLVGFCSANPAYRGVTEISWVVVAEGYRRSGIASGLLTAQTMEVFARGERAAYYAGSAGVDLDLLVTGLGFREVSGDFRFIPASSREQWRTTWGLAL